MGLLTSINLGLTEIFALLIVSVIIYVTHYYYKYFTRPNPLPGPFPLPLVGNLHLFSLDNYSKFTKKCHEKYGDLFELYFAGERQIYVGRLDAIDKLFNPSSKTNFKLRVLRSSGLAEFGVSGYGVVFNHDNKSWNFNRQFFTQAMLVPSFSQLTLTQTQKFLKVMMERWNYMSENNIGFDLRKWMFSFMTDLLLDVFVGREGCALDNHFANLTGQQSSGDSNNKDKLYVEYLLKYIEAFTFYLFFGTFAKYIPGLKSIAKKHNDNKERYWNLVYDIINEQKKVIEHTPKDLLRNDLINLLLTANTDHDVNISKSKVKDLYPEFQRPMNDKELMLNLTEALGGGIDSVSSTITFMTYNLVKNPNVVDKIRAEVVEILGENPRPIEVEDLDKFKYIEAVVKETARINSLVPLVDRYNEVPDEIAGYNWPANTHFIINSSGTQSDPKYWEDPEKFDPERFINSSMTNNNPKALVLFGGGVRICPGRKMAMIILKVLIAMLIHQFDFELVNPNEPIKSKFAVFNLPNELFIRVKKRSF